MNITDFRNLEQQLARVNEVTDFTLSQVDNRNWNGPDAQFIVSGANGLFVSGLVAWVHKNKAVIIEGVKKEQAAIVAQARLDAVREAEGFITTEKPIAVVFEKELAAQPLIPK